jgi:hypothetical protein
MNPALPSKPDPQPAPEIVFRVPWEDRYRFAAEILGIPVPHVARKEFTELPDADR